MEEEKSYQEIRRDLVQKYKTEVVPKLAELEKNRSSSCNSAKISGIKILKWTGIIVGGYYTIIILLSIVLSLGALLLGYKEAIQYVLAFAIFAVVAPFDLLPFIIIIGLFIWLFKYGTNANKFQKEVKSIVMPIFCSCFPDLRWVPEKEHLTEIYKNLNILPNFDFLEYDDCFVGSYKGINFVIEEVDARVKGKNGSSSVFRGIVIRFKNFNKKFKGHTVIQPAFFSIISSRNKNLHKTEMEDVVFEKKYNVYTNDDVEARYLITPTFMEKINKIKTVFKSEFVYCAFSCGQFFLSIHCSENLFDYGQIFNSLNDPKPFIKMSEEIISILKLIDYFKLDQDIGM